MIDLREAARYMDAISEEREGIEDAVTPMGIDPLDLLHTGRQRALRGIMLFLRDQPPTWEGELVLTEHEESVALMLTAISMDGIAIGARAAQIGNRHDSE